MKDATRREEQNHEMRCQQSGPINTIVALSSNEGGITTEQKNAIPSITNQTNNPVVAAQCRAQHEKNNKERDALRTTTTKQKLLLPYEQRDKYNNKKRDALPTMTIT